MSATGIWSILAKVSSPFAWTAIGILCALVLFVIPQSALDSIHILGPEDVLRPYVGWTFLLAISLLVTRALFAVGGGIRRVRERWREQDAQALRLVAVLNLLANPTPEFAQLLEGMREAQDEGVSVSCFDRVASRLVELGVAERLPTSEASRDRIRFSILAKAAMAQSKPR